MIFSITVIAVQGAWILSLFPGLNIDSVNEDGLTSLHLSTQMEDIESMKLFLKRDANIHAIDPEGYTALHFSVINGHFESVKLLLDNGADFETANKYRQTALHISAEKGQISKRSI